MPAPDGFACSIHADLPEHGFGGCVAFDCLGAGQLVTQHTFGGLTWRDRPERANEVFDAFLIVRQLQELRWYLRQADRGDQPAELRRRIRRLADHTSSLTEQRPAELLQTDVAAHRAAVDEVLRQVSRRVRTAAARAVRDVDASPSPDQTGRPGRRTAGRGRSPRL